MPIVAQPTAIVGRIQWMDGNAVHPNQNIPAGISIDSMQAKYNRPSGELEALPSLLARRSCIILTAHAIRDPTHIAVNIKVSKKYLTTSVGLIYM